MRINKKIPLLGFFILSCPVFANNSYIPVLYNLSLLYGFAPVPGAVKTLNISIENEKGTEVYRLEAALNPRGCLDSLRFNDKKKKSELILRRDERTLKGVKDWSIIIISLDEKCNVVSKTENGGLEQYITEENGRLTTTRFMGNKTSEYVYDTGGKVTMTRYYSPRGITATRTVAYSDPEHKPLDYKMVKTSRYSDNYTAESRCQYNQRRTPVTCDLTITFNNQSGRQPLKLKVLTEATFY